MLVIVMDDQLLAPECICESCLLADGSGQPRWQQGRLGCGQAVHKTNQQQPDQYDCKMGFRIANIK